MLFRAILALTAATVALANPLATRQTTNTNPQIGELLDNLSIQMREHMANVVTMQANGTATDGTVGTQVQQMITTYTNTASGLLALPVTSGSTTDIPTDIMLSREFGETLQLVATGFSGLPAQGTVPNFGAMISQLDPTVAQAATALNTTLPGALGFVHILMLDVSQFLVDEGAWPETLAAIGF